MNLARLGPAFVTLSDKIYGGLRLPVIVYLINIAAGSCGRYVI
jgi:hypothetical protein